MNRPKYYRPVLGIILLIVISTIAYFINKNYHAKNNKLQYADLVDSPLYPEERGGKLDKIESAISLYRSGNKSKAKKILMNANSSKSNYWLSEFYLQEEKIDSALMHLPKSNEVLNKRDRINFLNIVCLYLLGQTEKMTKAINELPSDTEQFYLAKYERLDFEK